MQTHTSQCDNDYHRDAISEGYHAQYLSTSGTNGKYLRLYVMNTRQACKLYMTESTIGKLAFTSTCNMKSSENLKNPRIAEKLELCLIVAHEMRHALQTPPRTSNFTKRDGPQINAWLIGILTAGLLWLRPLRTRSDQSHATFVYLQTPCPKTGEFEGDLLHNMYIYFACHFLCWDGISMSVACFANGYICGLSSKALSNSQGQHDVNCILDNMGQFWAQAHH